MKVFIMARIIFPAAEPTQHTDAAQDVKQDATQDVVEGVLGAAEDGGVKVLILPIVIFQRRNPRPADACRPPRCPWATREGGRARERRGAGFHGGRRGGRCGGRGAGLGLQGPGGVRPPRHATTVAAAVFVQLLLRWGRNWAAQWHLASAVGKRFRLPGVPREAPLCLLNMPLILVLYHGTPTPPR